MSNLFMGVLLTRVLTNGCLLFLNGQFARSLLARFPLAGTLIACALFQSYHEKGPEYRPFLEPLEGELAS